MTVLVENITCKMESEFYVTLPSNSSLQYFPDNKTLNFVTKLSRTLQPEGECEVGLAEIDYPHTWYNIRERKNSVEIYAPDNLYLVFKTVEYSGGGGVTCIRRDTGMCHYFGYFLGVAPGFLGTFFGLFLDFWVPFFDKI